MTLLFFLGLFAVVGFVFYQIAGVRHRKAAEARPRITAQEMTDFLARMAADTRDSLVLTLQERPTEATATRIGGRPWADPARPDWPLTPEGQPMTFLGQINFGDLPPLPDFPDSGLLQIFVDFTWSAPDRAPHLRFHDRPAGEGLMELPAAHLTGKVRPHPFSDAVLARGYAVTAEPRTVQATHFIWPHDAPEYSVDIYQRLPEPGEAEALVADMEPRMDALRESWGNHWIGGHPSFVQADIRHDEAYRALDRVILHLGEEGSGKARGIRIADAGELNVMIAAQDLRDRRWDRAVFNWDSS